VPGIAPDAAASDRIEEGDFHEGMVCCELGHDTGRTGNSGSCSACHQNADKRQKGRKIILRGGMFGLRHERILPQT